MGVTFCGQKNNLISLRKKIKMSIVLNNRITKLR